jgi:hypothetical protein
MVRRNPELPAEYESVLDIDRIDSDDSMSNFAGALPLLASTKFLCSRSHGLLVPWQCLPPTLTASRVDFKMLRPTSVRGASSKVHLLNLTPAQGALHSVRRYDIGRDYRDSSKVLASKNVWVEDEGPAWERLPDAAIKAKRRVEGMENLVFSLKVARRPSSDAYPNEGLLIRACFSFRPTIVLPA